MALDPAFEFAAPQYFDFCAANLYDDACDDRDYVASTTFDWSVEHEGHESTSGGAQWCVEDRNGTQVEDVEESLRCSSRTRKAQNIASTSVESTGTADDMLEAIMQAHNARLMQERQVKALKALRADKKRMQRPAPAGVARSKRLGASKTPKETVRPVLGTPKKARMGGRAVGASPSRGRAQRALTQNVSSLTTPVKSRGARPTRGTPQRLTTPLRQRAVARRGTPGKRALTPSKGAVRVPTPVKGQPRSRGKRPVNNNNKRVLRTSHLENDADLAALLKAHNKKFADSKVTYVPQKHSVKDIRAYERETGTRWYSLTPAEREEVNRALDQQKIAARQRELDAI